VSPVVEEAVSTPEILTDDGVPLVVEKTVPMTSEYARKKRELERRNEERKKQKQNRDEELKRLAQSAQEQKERVQDQQPRRQGRSIGETVKKASAMAKSWQDKLSKFQNRFNSPREGNQLLALAQKQIPIMNNYIDTLRREFTRVENAVKKHPVKGQTRIMTEQKLRTLQEATIRLETAVANAGKIIDELFQREEFERQKSVRAAARQAKSELSTRAVTSPLSDRSETSQQSTRSAPLPRSNRSATPPVKETRKKVLVSAVSERVSPKVSRLPVFHGSVEGSSNSRVLSETSRRRSRTPVRNGSVEGSSNSRVLSETSRRRSRIPVRNGSVEGNSNSRVLSETSRRRSRTPVRNGSVEGNSNSRVLSETSRRRSRTPVRRRIS